MRCNSSWLTCILFFASVPAIADHPNIVLITTDDIGLSDIGCYCGEIETPNIARMRGETKRWRQFTANRDLHPRTISRRTNEEIQ